LLWIFTRGEPPIEAEGESLRYGTVTGCFQGDRACRPGAFPQERVGANPSFREWRSAASAMIDAPNSVKMTTSGIRSKPVSSFLMKYIGAPPSLSSSATVPQLRTTTPRREPS
jgi:hypothetical protein